MEFAAPQLAILLGAVAVFAVAAIAFGDDKNHKTTKRLKNVSGNAKQARARGARVDQTKERRRHISENLKRIEEKQREKSAKSKVSLATRMERAGWTMTVRDFWMVSAICALVLAGIGFLSGQSIWVTAAMSFVGFFGIPRFMMARSRKKRMKKFVDEFTNAIDSIVRGVKSGLPVNECLRNIARDAQSPVKEEFHLLVEGMRVGLSMEEALERMHERVPLGEVNFFAIVLVIQQQTGGNLADALGNLSGVLRSRRSMLGKVAALSMEAKASAVILGAMPVFVTALITLASPDYLEPLYTTSLGKILLLIAAGLMGTGIFIMRSMIQIKV